MIFESHCHYEDHAFDDDRDEILKELPEKLIETAIDVGSTIKSSAAAVELSEKYSYIYAAVGVHPEELDDIDPDKIRELTTHKKVVAIGEIGLDHFRVKDSKEQANQSYWFKKQLEMARELDLPVIIHSRDAAEETFDILKDAAEKGTRGVIHCYSYSPEMAREFIKMGYYIGVGGVVTFKNSKKLKDTVLETPLERILTETDCPYMAPEPFRGMRNDSTYIPYMIKKIAQIKEITEDEVMEQTRRNGHEFFGI